jgi:hypothetical protein
LPPSAGTHRRLTLQADDDQCVVTCLDGERLSVLEASDARGPIDFGSLRQRLENAPIPVS